MRVNSRWFDAGTERSAGEIGGAAAFIAFRVARNAQNRLRRAGFALPSDATYFAVLAEFLACLVCAADRVAQRRGDAAWRVAFVTALANRAGAILAENEAELLGGEDAARRKERFIALVNARTVDYAACGWRDGPDYDFLRCAGHRIGDAMAPGERTWAVSQVIEIEAPEAIGTLRRALCGLLDRSPRRAPAREATRGE
jgi:hypothetical protein